MSPYFDIIFAGGGTTACVVAGRLIETDPNLKILIVEPGPHIKGIETHVQPARYFSNLASETTLARYVAKPNPALDGRQVVVPTGKCVGGGSAVNFMMYTRAAASDYDDWEKLGNPGWGAKDLIPLAEKLENYEPFGDERASHGSSGPIHVSPGGHATSIGRDFLEMAALYDKDRTFAQDINDFTTCNAYGRWAKYIGHQTGERSDAAHSYIYDKPDSENLVIITGKRVNRVLIENGTATGVECVDDKGPSSEIEVFNASKLVVLSAGAFGSPTILERSGIGASKILNAYGIPQLVDLPGVGENYNDHNLYTPTFFVDEATSDSMTELLRDVDHESVAHHLALWKETRRGLLAHNSIDAGIKIRPTAQEVEDLGPEFKPLWNSFYAPAPDKPLYFIGPSAGYLGISPVSRKAMSMIYYAEYLASIGTVHISSTDPYAPVDFDCAYLTDRFDVIAARYAYKRSREYARRMTCYRGEYISDQPAFSSTGAAALQAFANPTPPDAPDILYTAEDDEAIDAWHRARVATTWHSLGTCAMKPREAMGVVDPRLNVYGVRNLKVADLSIAPLNVSANTYNTTLIIGEKAFIIIAEDLGTREAPPVAAGNLACRAHAQVSRSVCF